MESESSETTTLQLGYSDDISPLSSPTDSTPSPLDDLYANSYLSIQNPIESVINENLELIQNPQKYLLEDPLSIIPPFCTEDTENSLMDSLTKLLMEELEESESNDPLVE